MDANDRLGVLSISVERDRREVGAKRFSTQDEGTQAAMLYAVSERKSVQLILGMTNELHFLDCRAGPCIFMLIDYGTRPIGVIRGLYQEHLESVAQQPVSQERERSRGWLAEGVPLPGRAYTRMDALFFPYDNSPQQNHQPNLPPPSSSASSSL